MSHSHCSPNDELPDLGVAVALRCMQLCCAELFGVEMSAGIDECLYVISQPCRRSHEKRGVAGAVAQMNRGSLGKKVAKDLDIVARRREML